MKNGSSQKGRVKLLLACTALGLSFVYWVGHRTDQDEPPAAPVLEFRSRFVPPPAPAAQELPAKAEKSLSDSKLPVYELNIAPGDLRAIEANPYGNTTYSATFIAAGKTYRDVKVRARGSWSRSWPKKSLKIAFDHQHQFEGHRCLNLNSAWRDPAFIREVIAYKVFAACGVPASEARIVRLQVNGHFHGLYVEVEQPDKEFLSHHNLKGAAVYKAASRSRDADERERTGEQAYQSAYTKETKKTDTYSDLIEFCQTLAHESNTTNFFYQNLDVQEYINYLAATVLVQNWDGFNKNHFLAHDNDGSKKWYVIPWDLDRTLGDHWHMTFDESQLPILLGTRGSPGVTGWNRIEERFFADPTLRTRFLERLTELLDTEFTTTKLFPLIDQLEAEISAAVELDRQLWPAPNGELHDGIAGVKSFIERRRAYLQAEIPKLRGS